MKIMNYLQISVEAKDQDWKQRCNEMMENLKQFPGQDSSSQTELVKEKQIINFEMYEAVDNGDVDKFIDVLEKVSAVRDCLYLLFLTKSPMQVIHCYMWPQIWGENRLQS